MEKIKLIIDSNENVSYEEDEKNIEENKTFLKSIGLKSDSVGWTDIDLNNPKAKTYMEMIQHYAHSKNRTIRIGYEWRKEFEDSDWYMIEPKLLLNETRVFKQNKLTGESACIGICSYKIPKREPIIMWDFMKATAAVVSKEFADSAKRHGLTGAEFVWAYDGGKYQGAEFYRMVNVKQCDIFFGCSAEYIEKLLKRNKTLLGKSFGPNWEWLVQHDIKNELAYLDVLPMPAGKEPVCDFMRCGEFILASHHAIECLMKDGVLGKENIYPCQFAEDVPLGYKAISSAYSDDFLTTKEMEEIEKEHERFKKVSKPRRKITKKEVLSRLKEQKRISPENFNKPLKKNMKEKMDSQYQLLGDYLGISDGMLLSDEIRFCSYAELLDEQREYERCKMNEESLNLPNGQVIAKAMDGDVVLLMKEGVKRFSHEDWAVMDEWENIESFIMEEMDII